MIDIIDRVNDDIIQNRLCEKIMNVASKNSFYSKLCEVDKRFKQEIF